MIALLSAILLASLLGSTHCAGMCGAFVAFAVSPGTGAAPSRLALNVSYNLGRLATYLTLGTLAGTLGAAIDLGGSIVGVQRAAGVLAGFIMAVAGLSALVRAASMPIPRLPVPAALIRLSSAAHSRVFDLPPLARAAAVGTLTTLLPCGWLYAFVIAAAGTGSSLGGAGAMLAFWVGTLPILAAIGLGAQALTGSLRPHLPVLTSLLLVGAGAWSMFGRVPLTAASFTRPRAAASMEDAMNAVRTADQACPLCHDAKE